MRQLIRSALALAIASSAVVSAVALNQDAPGLMMASGSSGRQAVALMLKTDAALVDGLHSRGIATMVRETTDLTDVVSAITSLHNDPRVVSVTVVGPGAIAGAAAQIARADAIVAIDGAATKPLVSRVIATREITGAADAADVASFINGLTLIRHPATQRASLRATVVATIGTARVSLEYGRPSRRGRAIWGALVPWGRWWMPGADESTVITNTEAITIGTLLVPAGEHTLYTMPSDTDFMLIVNNDVGQFHTMYRPDLDLGRTKMTSAPTTNGPEQMTFAIGISDTSGTSGTLSLAWGDRQFSVPVTLATPRL